ncbi:MAG: hypothetical protein EXS09_01615 [Gemmataceae bacterium]|nr:hypothetical protein [Gemmataceae bacterium]
MRAILLALPLAALFAAPVRSDEASDLRDRVLKAYAKDPSDIKKIRLYSLKAKGIARPIDTPEPVNFEMVAGWPGHFKATAEFGDGANKRVIILCGADDRGWKKVTGAPPMEMSFESMNDFRADTYAVWVSTLLTLTDAASKLSAAGKAKVGDDPVLGLKITQPARPDITLFFHEKTGLLRKMTYRSRDAGATTTKDMFYAGHKEFGGLMLPTHQTTQIDGKDLYTWTDMEYKFLDKLDQKLFVPEK